MANYTRFLRFILIMLVVTGAFFASDASARDKAQVEAEFLQAFERMYRQPGSVALTLDYAKLAIEKGDFEAALSPLERLLMLNPSLPEVRLELGVMYFKLNSKLVAKEHLRLVAEDLSASEEVQKRAKDFLAKL